MNERETFLAHKKITDVYANKADMLIDCDAKAESIYNFANVFIEGGVKFSFVTLSHDIEHDILTALEENQLKVFVRARKCSMRYVKGRGDNCVVLETDGFVVYHEPKRAEENE